MSDIAEKLRELSRWLLATDTDIKMPDDMIDPEIAADYTEVLEARLVEAAGLTAEIDRQNNRYNEMSAEADRLSKMVTAFRNQDAEIRAAFGGKRDGRPTIECIWEAFNAKWREEDALFEATLDMKTKELRAEVARLTAENELLRTLLKRHFARKPEPECLVTDDKKCQACVCGWEEWKTDEVALEYETRTALQDKSEAEKG